MSEQVFCKNELVILRLNAAYGAGWHTSVGLDLSKALVDLLSCIYAFGRDFLLVKLALHQVSRATFFHCIFEQKVTLCLVKAFFQDLDHATRVETSVKHLDVLIGLARISLARRLDSLSSDDV